MQVLITQTGRVSWTTLFSLFWFLLRLTVCLFSVFSVFGCQFGEIKLCVLEFIKISKKNKIPHIWNISCCGVCWERFGVLPCHGFWGWCWLTDFLAVLDNLWQLTADESYSGLVGLMCLLLLLSSSSSSSSSSSLPVAAYSKTWV